MEGINLGIRCISFSFLFCFRLKDTQCSLYIACIISSQLLHFECGALLIICCQDFMTLLSYVLPFFLYLYRLLKCECPFSFFSLECKMNHWMQFSIKKSKKLCIVPSINDSKMKFLDIMLLKGISFQDELLLTKGLCFAFLQ